MTNPWLVSAAALLFTAPLFGAPAAAPAPEKPPPAVDQARIDAAIERGGAWVRALLREGLPPLNDNSKSNNPHSTYNEFVLYTLLHAGADRNDPDIVKLLDTIREQPPRHTYTAAMRAMAFELYDAEKLRGELAHCVLFLQDNQAKTGRWSYGEAVPLPPLPKITLTGGKGAADAPRIASGPGGGTISSANSSAASSSNQTTARKTQAKPRRTVIPRRAWGECHDNSNTQYALLGLAACMAAGLSPGPDCFSTAEKWWTDDQNTDGGWGYAAHRKQSCGSMTAGGVSSMAILLGGQGHKSPLKDPRLQRGLQWLGQNLTYEQNPGYGPWKFYWIYSIERAGSMAGTEWFGDRAWYSEGVDWLLPKQQGNGSWGGGTIQLEVEQTCWAILFLRRATKHIASKIVRTLDSRAGQ